MPGGKFIASALYKLTRDNRVDREAVIKEACAFPRFCQLSNIDRRLPACVPIPDSLREPSFARLKSLIFDGVQRCEADRKQIHPGFTFVRDFTAGVVSTITLIRRSQSGYHGRLTGQRSNPANRVDFSSTSARAKFKPCFRVVSCTTHVIRI